jgi:hypothetical protein
LPAPIRDFFYRLFRHFSGQIIPDSITFVLTKLALVKEPVVNQLVIGI